MSPRLSTGRKIAIARWLSRLVLAARAIAGSGAEAVCTRLGVRWSLDLREGVQLAIYLGLYEGTTRKRLMQSVPRGGSVIDVGANVGAHALPLARAIHPRGRVVAVEPTDAAFARLLRNHALNPALASSLVPVQAALGAPGGTLDGGYYSSWQLGDDPDRHPVHLGSSNPATGARFLTLDALARELELPTIGLIKIDVDGREMEVLAGATEVIARDRPVIVFELCPYLLVEYGRSADSVIEFFETRGYGLLDEETLQPLRTPAEILAAMPARGGRNLVARPA